MKASKRCTYHRLWREMLRRSFHPRQWFDEDGLPSAPEQTAGLNGDKLMWVYRRSETGPWTVGYHDPDGAWHAESDHDSASSAAARVSWLNGGTPSGDTSLMAEEPEEVGMTPRHARARRVGRTMLQRLAEEADDGDARAAAAMGSIAALVGLSRDDVDGSDTWQDVVGMIADTPENVEDY